MNMRKLLATLFFLCSAMAAMQREATPKATFRVKHVTEDAVYLDGGRSTGLTEGMTLIIKRKGVYDASSGVGEIKADVIVARLAVVTVSNTSAMCEIRKRNFDIQAGDIAQLMRPEDEKPVPLWTSGAAPISQPVNAIPERQSLAERVRANLGRPARSQSTPAAETTAVVAPAPANPPMERTGRLVIVPSEQKSNSQPGAVSGPPSNPQPETSPAATRITPGSGTPVAPAAVTASNPPITKQATGSPVEPTRNTASKTAEASSIEVNGRAATARPDTSPAVAATTTATSIATANVTASETARASAAAQPPPPNMPPVSTKGGVSVPPGPTEPIAPGRVSFKVKYVAQDAVYIDGGKNAGLAEGMMLAIKRANVAPGTPDAPANSEIAELAVVSVSSSSAVCEVRQKTLDIQRGDIALLSQADQDKMVQMRTLSPDRKYPQVIAFSEGDPLDEEARESVPKPPLPEVNRARGRIGVDYSAIRSTGNGVTTTSAQGGGVVRVDMSRIAGTYWNLNGYWRGRMNLRNSSGQPQTVFDLVNRTYTIGLTYANPQSRWTAGIGRLYLPWATSLDTNDGGYLARKFGSHVTVGVFGGTAPDPTSFDYNPDRQTGGTFIAFEGGSFDSARFTSTEGVAVTGIDFREDRQFLFSENGLFIKKFLSIYHSAQADRQRLPLGGTTEGLSRSFATVRIQPFSRLSFDVNHNYFRDVPTFDPLLVSTGLLDKFLFQGFSAGARLDLPGHISVYNNFGQSNKTGDAHSSFNQLYGVTVGRLWKTGIRGDVRYSQFSSSFGDGTYRALAISRSFAELLRIEVTAGKQNFVSSLGVPTDYRLLGSTMDWNLGRRYFFETGYNWQQGTQQTFDQWFMTMGYRFDTGRHR
jgi:hypothetical protein